MQRFILAGLFLAMVPVCGLAASPWPAVDPAEFKSSASKIDPEAGLEIILRELVIDDSDNGSETRHYVKARVYNQRGVEALAKIEIPFDKQTKISGIEARTTRPDGSTVLLGRGDVYERDVFKAGNVRVRVKTFVPPVLEPGVVVEYRYLESGDIPFFHPMNLQQDHPCRTIRYKIRPAEIFLLGLRCLYFNTPKAPLDADKKGFYTFEKHSVPARKAEPDSPAALSHEPVVMLYYTPFANLPPGTFWGARCYMLFEETQTKAKTTKSLREAVSRIVNASDSLSDQLVKIHDFCRTRIINRDRGSAPYTLEQRRKLPVNKTAADVLKNGNGTSEDINLLFVALVRTAGLDARLALANDRTVVEFHRNMQEPFVLSHLVAAVYRDSWQFFDPGSTFLPAGSLDWKNADTVTMVGDSQEVRIEPTAGSTAEANTRTRSADFRLLPDGTLEGTVSEEFAGLADTEMKRTFDGTSEEGCRKLVTENLQKALAGAEVESMEIRNIGDVTKPIALSYKLRIPGFAQRTGTRLIFAPSVFEKASPPRYTAESRQTDICIPYRSTQIDRISILPPAGYQLEAPSAPGGVDLSPGLYYQTRIDVGRSTGLIQYERRLGIREVFIKHTGYRWYKDGWDRIKAKDGHLLTLKKVEEAPRATTPGATAALAP